MEQIVNFIIRPPRADYIPKDDLLDQEFMLKGRWFHRKDFEVFNGRGNKLKCSHYLPREFPEGKALPCVIYCHGNSGCRADASEAAILLLPSNITVFTLDFSGSGLSEGEHVTLGWNEKDDLKSVVNHLRTDRSISCIGLWGRSMGAVTSLMHGAEDPSIAGMVLDSPFSNLVDLMMELVDTYRYPLPKFTIKLAIQRLRKAIKKKAGFDIMDLNTTQVAKRCFVPVLFGHARDDDFIRPHHSDRVFDSYAGDKNIIKFDGDHNSLRPQFYFDSISIFFHNVLNPPEDVSYSKYSFVVDNLFDEGRAAIYEKEHGISDSSSTTSQEDVVSQLRSRRPMSRTEVPLDMSSQGKEFVFELQENVSGSDQNTSFPKNDMNHSSNWGSLSTPIVTDDEYVDSSFDTFSDIPCSIEDEEQMLLEAIMESLKENCETPSTVGDCSTNTYDSTDTKDNGPSAVCGSTYVGIGDHASFHSDPYVEDSCAHYSTAKDSTSDDAKSDCISRSSSGSITTQDTDISDVTRTRFVLEKGPASHIMDGLAHRWGLNFSRR